METVDLDSSPILKNPSNNLCSLLNVELPTFPNHIFRENYQENKTETILSETSKCKDENGKFEDKTIKFDIDDILNGLKITLDKTLDKHFPRQDEKLLESQNVTTSEAPKFKVVRKLGTSR